MPFLGMTSDNRWAKIPKNGDCNHRQFFVILQSELIRFSTIAGKNEKSQNV